MNVKKNIHIILAIMLAPLIFYLILKIGWTDVSCEQLSAYDYDNFKAIGELIKVVLSRLIIFGSGILVFYFLQRFLRAFQNKYIQVAYIGILWAIIFYPGFRVANQNYNDALFISSLCNKTTGNAMHVKSNNVTYPEYEYLQGKLILLPDISPQSDSIQIDYYHDGFLPDFSLDILLRVPINDTIKTDERRWFEKSKGGQYKWLEFRDGDH
jgi:hypothetical protein